LVAVLAVFLGFIVFFVVLAMLAPIVEGAFYHINLNSQRCPCAAYILSKAVRNKFRGILTSILDES
jgi:hypothetical protein